MEHLWVKQLPGKYRNLVVRPIAFEYHTEPSQCGKNYRFRFARGQVF